MLSNYKPDSEWSEVNRDAAERPVKVSPELFELLSACLEYSRQSEGAFDITVGPLMKVWGFYKGTGHLPHRAEVAAALAKVGYRHILLDAATRTVRFDRPGVEIDPGGIGKGYAVDRMVDVLRQNGIQIALVAGSGSSIYGMGAPPDEPRGWQVKIRDPRDARQDGGGGVPEGRCRCPPPAATRSSSGRKARSTATSWTRGPAIRRRAVLSVSVIAPAHPRQRGLDQTVFHQRPPVGGEAQTKGFRVFFCEDRTEQPCAWLQ